MFRIPVPRVTQALLVSAVASGSLLLSACGSQASSSSAAAPSPTPVKAAAVSAKTVERGDMQQTLAYSGDIRAREQISVLPKASGRIEKVLVDVGSSVKAGDTIASLEQDSAQI